MDFSTDDIVASVGRIKTIQNGGPRYIQFAAARVISTDEAGITVNPIGRDAILLCKPDDLELTTPADKKLKETPASRQSAAQQAAANKAERHHRCHCS